MILFEPVEDRPVEGLDVVFEAVVDRSDEGLDVVQLFDTIEKMVENKQCEKLLAMGRSK